MKKYYKIVRKNMMSAIVGKNKDVGIKYLIGIWVFAPEWLAKKGYHLTCFGSLANARRFNIDCGDDIYECDVCGIVDKPIKTDSRALIEQGVLFVNKQNVPGDFYYSRYWPVGTIMVEKIKLIKKIE